MRNILRAFLGVFVLMLVMGGFGFYVWTNQPMADIASPPVPPEPTNAPKERPPVPKEPRLAGDTIDDGFVDALDINGLINKWKTTNQDYNLVNQDSGASGYLDSLDLAQVIKYWKCMELRTDKECPYTTNR